MAGPSAPDTDTRTTDTRMYREIYKVSRLNREARGILERGFATLWIEGELSNFARPASGHWYFSLKDAAAAKTGNTRKVHVKLSLKEAAAHVKKNRKQN